MSDSDRVERGAELLERLLGDADFRARFRARPEEACREAGFSDFADEIAAAGSGLQTLELRESRSSLVGVMMAAAIEGMGVLELSRLAGGGLSGEAAAAANRALTRAGMPAVRQGAARAGLHPLRAPRVPGVSGVPRVPGGVRVPGELVPSAAEQAAAAPDGAVPGAAPGDPAVADAAAADATPGGPVAAAEPTAPVQPAAAAASAGPAAPAEPVAAAASAGSAAPAASAGPAAPAAPAEPWPSSPGTGGATDEGGWPAAAQQDGAVARSAALPDAPEPAAAAGPASFEQLVENPRLELPPAARADFLSGDVDPRLARVLETLTKEHDIGLSVVKTGHDKFVAGTSSISNHFHGRGLDIATVDGAPVGPGNPAARELMSELANLDPAIRPSEVGGPWALAAPGFFTNAGHQDHIHIGFDDPAPETEQPATPAPAQAGAEAPVPPPAPSVTPEASARADAPAASPRRTIQFTAADDAGQPRAAARAAAFDDAGQPRAAAAAEPEAPAVPTDEPSAGGGGFDPVAAARDYPGDRASKPALAHWMAKWARRAGLPGELPIMASLVESGLTNVNYGDRDSLGFFQMRTGIWLERYPDFPTRPELQLKWFFDQALAVKEQRVGRGDTGFLNDPGQWGNWIADIERPAAEYRGRYQLRLAEARSLLGRPAGPPAADAAPAARAASVDAPAAPRAAGRSPRATIEFIAATPEDAAPRARAAGVAMPAPLPGADITAPGTPPHELREIFERAAALDAQELPYLWGGGHQPGVADVDMVGPVDCSGAVSAVLGVDARVSGAFETWGEPGPGRHVTVYANDVHVLMEINGHFFGTSASNPGGGAGWIPRSLVSESYLARFTARHPPGL